MSQYIRFPASSSTPSASVGIIGALAPTSADLIGFVDPSGDLAPGHVDAVGNILVSPSSSSGRSVVTTSYNDYGTTPVTTGAWVQLVASLGAAVNELQIYDTSGEVMEIGTGAAASETRLFLMPRGGNGAVQVTIPVGTRISIRSVTGTANTANTENIINFFS